MNLRATLSDRISMRIINSVCSTINNPENTELKSQLLTLVFDKNDRIAYNALWVMTHLDKESMMWLNEYRDKMINLLLQTSHTGKKRLLLSLLNRMPLSVETLRSDYLDFCFGRICSTDPYAVRSHCMKQAFAHCKIYPELATELLSNLQLMEFGEMSPAVESTRREILCKLEKLRKSHSSLSSI